jgi:geranylgeranyl pyrophosphate synthase
VTDAEFDTAVTRTILSGVDGLPPAMTAAATAVITASAKRLRARLVRGCHALADPTGTVTEEVVAAGAIVEMLHLASLLHDDVVDEAVIRRGVPAVQQVSGREAAIVVGLAVFTRALDLAVALGEDAAWQVSSIAAALAEGQILDCDRAFDLDLNIDDYLRLARKKTGVLFGLSCWLGAAADGLPREDRDRVFQFGETLGVAYQIADDCVDFVADTEVSGKRFGADWAAGVYGAPTILALGSGGDAAGKLRSLLARSSVRPEEFPRARQLVVDAGGFTDGAQLIDSLVAAAANTLGTELSRRDTGELGAVCAVIRSYV